MKLLDYIRTLGRSFTKDELSEALRVFSQALQKSLETFMNAEPTISGFKSKAGQNFESEFDKIVKRPPRLSVLGFIRQTLANMSVTAEMLSAIAEKQFAQDVVVEGITYKRAELLRTIGYMDFVVSYSMQLLHYILVAEASVTSKEYPDGKERPRPELEFLQNNQRAFLTLLATFARPSRELVTLLESIPDITIGDNDDRTIVPTVGINKLDPLKNNFIPIITRGALTIGIAWAHFQVWRYERLKEDAKCIQLRLEQLRLQAQGKQDAQLERTIEKYEQYLNRTVEKLAKMQEKWA